MSSFNRRNSDWQAYGQHRERKMAWVAKSKEKSRSQQVEEYQAQFEKPVENKKEQENGNNGF